MRSALRPTTTFRFTALLGVFAALLVGLLSIVRPWYESWGATPEESAAVLPGDSLTPGRVRETRAIGIEAPAAQVFAWVAQLGQDRAGFYSYELLEDLVGCEMPNLQALDPTLQHWRVGDKLWMYPPAKLDGMGHATLLYHEPDRALVFGTNTPADASGSSPTGAWSFVVTPTGARSSRLLTRASGGAIPSLLGVAYTRTIFEPLHFAMERRMLEGIRGLAEGRPISRLRDNVQLVCWLSTFSLFIVSGVLVLVGSHVWRRLIAFAASGIAFQVVTLVQPFPLLSVGLVLGLCGLLWPYTRSGAQSAPSLAERVS
jgi:hypothetical protein